MQTVRERERAKVGSALVLWDPATATTGKEDVREVLQDTLGARFWRYDLREIGDDAALEGEVRRVRDEGYDLVAVAGGNSAVRRVATALSGSGIPLGILPVGSTNLLARELGIPDNLFEAAAILAGEHRLVDVDAMRVGSRQYLLQIGIGSHLGAEGSEESDDPEPRRGLNWLSYLGNTLRNLLGRGGTRYYVTIDGQRRRIRARQIVIANAGGMGAARMRWAPGIKPTDGQLDLVVLRSRGLPGYLRLAWRLLRKRNVNRLPVSCYPVRERVEIVARTPAPVVAGRRVIQDTPLTVELVPKAVKVIAPRRERPIPIAVPVETRVSRRPVPLRTALVRWFGPIGALDTAAFLVIHRMPKHPAMNRLMKGIDHAMAGGDGWILWLTGARVRDLRRLTGSMVDLAPSLWLTSAVIEFPIKFILRRERPFKTLVLSAIVGRRHKSFSFPSGHAATAFAGAWLLARQFPRWSPFFFGTAALVAFSRVYVGVHYLSDVVVGSAAGVGLARLFRDVQRRLTRQVEVEGQHRTSSGRYLTFVFTMIVVSHALRLLTLRITHRGHEAEPETPETEGRTPPAL
jgi:diacylglycerol kinase (ATP)